MMKIRVSKKSFVFSCLNHVKISQGEKNDSLRTPSHSCVKGWLFLKFSWPVNLYRRPASQSTSWSTTNLLMFEVRGSTQIIAFFPLIFLDENIFEMIH